MEFFAPSSNQAQSRRAYSSMFVTLNHDGTLKFHFIKT